jgi:hypothetical protein
MEQACLEPKCDRSAVARGLCATCYARHRRHGTLPPKEPPKTGCSVDGCEKKHEAHGLCALHYDRLRSRGTVELEKFGSDSERFWAKVDKTGDCWLWTGGVHKKTGYGNFWWKGTTHLAHRFAYMEAFGRIPAGKHLDHLCRTRTCVRPDHLEAVLQAVNNMRSDSPSARNAVKTHCKRGHEFTPENTYVPPKRPNSRACRICQAIRDARRR